MAEAQAGDTGPIRPFDRQALQATLADALKDAESADASAPEPTGAATPPRSGPPQGSPGPHPFGRPNSAAIPTPTPAPRPSAPAAPNTRTGPSILAGGITAAVSPLPSPLGGAVSGFRAPDGGGSLPGLSARPLGPLGGIGTTDEPAEPPATIAIRRPERATPPAATPTASEAATPAASEAATPPPAARPSVALAGWMPSDDDILPRSAHAKRRSRAGR